MLGAIREFLYGWQFIHLTVFTVAWLGGGSWLLMRSLRKHDTSKRARFGKCASIALLAGVVGGITGMAISYMINAIGGQVQVDLRVPGLVMAAVAAVASAFFTLYAALEVTMRKTLTLVAVPMIVLMALGAAIGGDAAVRADFRCAR